MRAFKFIANVNLSKRKRTYGKWQKISTLNVRIYQFNQIIHIIHHFRRNCLKLY